MSSLLYALVSRGCTISLVKKLTRHSNDEVTQTKMSSFVPSTPSVTIDRLTFHAITWQHNLEVSRLNALSRMQIRSSWRICEDCPATDCFHMKVHLLAWDCLLLSMAGKLTVSHGEQPFHNLQLFEPIHAFAEVNYNVFLV